MRYLIIPTGSLEITYECYSVNEIYETIINKVYGEYFKEEVIDKSYAIQKANEAKHFFEINYEGTYSEFEFEITTDFKGNE